MANKIDQLKWKLFLIKNKYDLLKGASTGKIQYYDDELINNLNNIYYGGIPASVIILIQELCNGFCYDRALLLSTGFNKDDEFQIVRGSVNSIELNPEYIGFKKENPLYADHCVVEKKDKDGIVWVYDPSDGLRYEKEHYYKSYNFRVRHISSKEETLNYSEYQDIINTDITSAKEAAPLLIPLIEQVVFHSNSIYREKALELLNQYKEKIEYDNISYSKKLKGLKK